MITVVQHLYRYTTSTAQRLSWQKGGKNIFSRSFLPPPHHQSNQTTQRDAVTFVSDHHFKFGSLLAAAQVVLVAKSTPLWPVGQEDERGGENLIDSSSIQTQSFASDVRLSTAAAGSLHFRWKRRLRGELRKGREEEKNNQQNLFIKHQTS